MPISYDNHACLSVLCSLKGSVIPNVLPRALLFGLVGGVAVFLHYKACPNTHWATCPEYKQYFDSNADLHTYLTIVVGLMLVFRTNSSYARFDLGIGAMGALRIHARVLVSQACSYVKAPSGAADIERADVVEDFRRLVMLYCMMFKRHIHEQDDKSLESSRFQHLLGDGAADMGGSRRELESLNSASSGARTVLITAWLRRRVGLCLEKGMIKECHVIVMDGEITKMIENYQRGCRIAFIAMPFAYAQVVKWIITIYCGVTPFAYVADLHWATPLASFMVSLLVFCVDEIGVEIENPFGLDACDIDMNGIVCEIDEQCAEILAERNGTSKQRLIVSAHHICGHPIDQVHTEHEAKRRGRLESLVSSPRR